MVFSSTLFLFLFLPVTLLGYGLFPGKIRNYWLLAVSLLFFGWSQPGYLWIILISIAVNYCGGRLAAGQHRLKKAVLGAVIAVNLGLLFYFKYFDFTLESVNALLHTGFALRHIVLPIGISFFTFQGMSYVIDVYRGDVPAQRNPLKIALYITLFPQLIAGPIVRYRDIAEQMDERRISVEAFSCGVERFIIGLSKKCLISNTLAAAVDHIWMQGAGKIPASVAWLGAVGYMLQIYFDFSGYSDMAIGLGRMFGFGLPENFDLPYIAKSITEFWRRWHITLSTWFRDYVYIPLGGNRKHLYRNLAVVFLLTGIWHGAAWNFILWGVWNGVLILAERRIGFAGRAERFGPMGRVLCRVYTLTAVLFGWVLFRAPDLQTAVRFALNMFGRYYPGAVGFTLRWYLDGWTVLMLLCGILFSTGLPERIGEKAAAAMPGSIRMTVRYGVLLVLFALCAVSAVSGSYNPFIYFQF